MLASITHWLVDPFRYLNHAYWWSAGANDWQWITSLVALSGWGFYFHARFGEDRCQHCWRKGTVPVKGEVHRHCRRHALEHGSTH